MPDDARAGFGAAADPRLPRLLALAREAGDAILRYYADVASARLHDKADGSPLTAADLAAHEAILAGLRRIDPGVPVISEENKGNPSLPEGATFWLVDPLDGTKEFLNHRDEFTVNIALVRDAAPVLAVVHAPALGITYAAQRGLGAWRIGNGEARPIGVAPARQGDLIVVASRSHDDAETAALLQRLPPHRIVSQGSSLKFCLVAEGGADFYPRLGATMEWDTAAGQCVLEAAGGRVVQCDGTPLRYNKPEWRNPQFLAAGAWLPEYDALTCAQRPAG